MNNPYKVLNLPQNASKEEVVTAKMKAMRDRKYVIADIQLAERSLLDPAKRLAADFMYPAKIRARRPQKIDFNLTLKKVKLDTINSDAFDTLK